MIAERKGIGGKRGESPPELEAQFPRPELRRSSGGGAGSIRGSGDPLAVVCAYR